MWPRGLPYMRCMYFVSGISHNTSISRINLLLALFSRWRNGNSRDVKSLSQGLSGSCWRRWDSKRSALRLSRTRRIVMLLTEQHRGSWTKQKTTQRALDCMYWCPERLSSHEESQQERTPARVRAPAGVTGCTPHSLAFFGISSLHLPFVPYLHDLKVSSYVTGSLLTIDCETGQIKCQFSMWQHSAGLCFKHAWSSSCKAKKERTEDKSFEAKKAYKAVVPNLLVTKGQFHGRLYFHILGVGGDGFGKIQVHYIKFALYFCYFISSSSDHQASDTSGRWGTLVIEDRVWTTILTGLRGQASIIKWGKQAQCKTVGSDEACSEQASTSPV